MIFLQFGEHLMIVTPLDIPGLMTRPTASPDSAARKFASTTLVDVCEIAPTARRRHKSPALRRREGSVNFEITPEYCEDGSCRAERPLK